MCALMGLAFAQPVTAGFSIREFAAQGEDNADGWGLAWYPDQVSVSVVKEPVSWRHSHHTQFLESYHHLQSRIFLAHVRHRTTGAEPTHADTHPFVRELNGREYCFAHNGTVDRTGLSLGRFRPVGGTDSEHLFCHLLEELARAGLDLAEESAMPWLHQKFRDWNKRGQVNCLLTDGRRLIVYHDHAGWKGLVFCRVTILGQGVHHFEDPTVAIDVEGEAYNRGYVIATAPLSGKGWQSVTPGELLAFENGRIRFSSFPAHQIGAGAHPAQRKP
jgi:glutamine amidotransferase